MQDWYKTLFSFANTYLKDDGGLLVFMPYELMYNLQRHVSKKGWVVKAEWMCYQAEPLIHVLFPGMMINLDTLNYLSCPFLIIISFYSNHNLTLYHV